MDQNSTANLLTTLRDYWFLIVPIALSIGSFFALRAEFNSHKEQINKRVDRLEDELKDDVKTIMEDVKTILSRGK